MVFCFSLIMKHIATEILFNVAFRNLNKSFLQSLLCTLYASVNCALEGYIKGRGQYNN